MEIVNIIKPSLLLYVLFAQERSSKRDLEDELASKRKAALSEHESELSQLRQEFEQKMRKIKDDLEDQVYQCISLVIFVFTMLFLVYWW